MKKLLLIFALLIFPLQVSWGMVETYCQPEQSLSSPQCTDCVHQSRTVANDAQDDAPSAAKSDLDCSQCSVNGVALVAMQLDILISPSDTVFRSIDPHLPLSTIVLRPERPQWSPAAA